MFYTIGLLLVFSMILLIFDHKSRYSWLFIMMSIGAMIAFFFIILHINMFASYGSYYSRSIYYKLDYLVFTTITNYVKIPIVTNIRMMNFGIFLYLLAVTIFNFEFDKDLLRANEMEKDKKRWNMKLLLFAVPVLSVILSDPVISTFLYIAYHTSSSPQWNDRIYRGIEIGYKLFVIFLLLRPVCILIKYVVKTKIYFLRRRISLFAAGLLLANGIFYFFFYVGTFRISVDKVIRSGFWVFGNIEAKVPVEYLAGSSVIFIIISVCMFILLSFNMDSSATLFAQKKIQKNVAIMNEVLGETLHSQKNLFFSMQILVGKIQKKVDGQMEIPEIARMEKLVTDSLTRTAEMLEGLKEVKLHYLNNSILDIVDDAVNEVTVPENMELIWDKQIYQDSKIFYGMYDKYHLEKALVNVVKNSIEAIEISGKADGKITISLSFLLRWLIIIIEDNGTGIRPREKKYIFSPHYSGKMGKMNWGLGLPYVYKVIKAHLGQIKIYSKYGEFTSVLIMLPTGKKKAERAYWGIENMDVIRVVIADDAEEIRLHLSEEISGKANKIEVVGLAKNGFEAVELTKKYLPDIVLMDIQMETRTAGITAIGKIHEMFPMVKCIALTIHENEEFIFRAYLAGAADYIIKTNPTEKIVNSIHAVMENKLLLRPEVGKKLIEEYQYVHENQLRMKETLQVMLMINTTEYEILKMVYAGYTYRKIAELRYVQETTIRSQINHILKKFKKSKMKEVIKLLHELKIFDE